MTMKVIVFNVEHGACAFVKTPTKHALLIDCGATETFSPAQYVADYELSDAAGHNGHALTGLIVTHPHDDHIQDISAVKEKCPPGILYRQKYDWESVKSEGAEEGDYTNLDAYSEWQNTYNQPLTVVPDFGLTLQRFFLSPDEAKKLNEQKYVNNSSIVTVISYKGPNFTETFLFGGDMEEDGWEALLKKADFKAAITDVDFFIVSHHGHSSGFSGELFKAMGKKPILNIISVHHGDEHVDGRYSDEQHATGTKFGGEDRRTLTTRKDGSVCIEVNEAGTFVVSAFQLKDNRLKKRTAGGWSW